MFKAYMAGELHIHPSCTAKVHAQIRSFNPLKTLNVDGILDCLTYAPRVIEEMGEFLRINTVEGRQEFENEEAVCSEAANSPF